MLTTDIERFIAIRRAAGFRFESAAWLLRSFGRFTRDRDEEFIKAETAIDWAAVAPTPGQRARRLQTVRLLAQFLRAEGDGHELPPRDVFCAGTGRKPPYILTADEIRCVVAAARQLEPPDSMRPWVYATLFGLLAATGMRVSEALALRFDDVTTEGLLIRDTKFRKSRLLPLSPTTIDALSSYLHRRRQVAGHDDRLFVSWRRHRLSYWAVYYTFNLVCGAAGVPMHGDPGRVVRLHDIRHTFAVNALRACPGDRDKATQHMLALTTYMGHARVSSTYWYLEATPELLGDIAAAAASVVHGGAA